jgi:anion-transporting  ArsA/GET3 family ATPase
MARLPADNAEFTELIANRKLVVCAGSGGVGKTTTSAVIGLHAALTGRKVLVLTIDPAKRLANSLGVSSLDNEAQQIPLERFQEIGLEPQGQLWAMMLDMKESFDQLVRRYSPSEENQRDILENRFYHYFSSSLAGTQEYAAAERLYELYEEESFDLIVLDTPPTTHALDFLDAPTRLASAVDNKALQWLYKPNVFTGTSGLGLFSVGTSYVVKTLGKFTGAELLSEMATFLKAFSTLFEGLRERARHVEQMLVSDACTFIVVTAPDPLTLDEAVYFYEELGQQQVAVGGFVVNRVHPRWVELEDLEQPAAQLCERLGALGAENVEGVDIQDFAERLLSNASDFQALASKDQLSLRKLTDHVSRETPVVTVPYFSQDVHSLSGLARVRTAIFDS